MKRWLFSLTLLFAGSGLAQTSTDLFVMQGSDFVRPGDLPRTNLNIGIGHTFAFLKSDPVGDEITFSYTYENGGDHGFYHTSFGSHTENVGLMKNFSVYKKLTGYTWPLIGITSLTGNRYVLNRLYGGFGLGAAIHFTRHSAMWVQETFNKIDSVPWYLSTSVGYTYSF